MSGTVTCATSDGVRTLTIDRPDKKNAFTAAMYDALGAALSEASDDPDVRVTLLRGTDGSFSAGNDLADFLDSPPDVAASPVVRFLHALARTTKPMVAAVEGPAIGIGCTLLLHCDLVYAAEGTRFALPFVPLGLSPEAASSLLLPRLAGLQRASELLLLGEPFDAERARECGIVNEVLPADRLHERAEERARALAARPPGAVAATRALIRREWTAAIREALDAELPVFAERLASPEAQAAFARFLKR